MNSFTSRIILSCIPLVILFGLGEIGLRFSGWPKPTASFEHNEPFWIVDPDLKRSVMPHKEENTSFLVSTNENGLRSSSISPNTDNNKRIITLGCSTTFGWGVSDEEAYPSRLQYYIEEADIGNAEVINAGQPGYTSFQGTWLWDQVLKDYSPDIVLIGYIVQDARKAAYSDKSQAILQSDNRFLKDNFLYRSKIYLSLRYALGKVQIQAKERSSQDEGGAYRVPPADYVENLRSLVSKVKSVGATPVLFGYPLERTGYTEAHRRILQAAAEELSTPHFDPQEKMEKATQSETLYFPRDKGHANAAGNDLIAQWVFSFLRANGLVGKKDE
jgi:lysophospholipase L1-like esterase